MTFELKTKMCCIQYEASVFKYENTVANPTIYFFALIYIRSDLLTITIPKLVFDSQFKNSASLLKQCHFEKIWQKTIKLVSIFCCLAQCYDFQN